MIVLVPVGILLCLIAFAVSIASVVGEHIERRHREHFFALRQQIASIRESLNFEIARRDELLRLHGDLAGRLKKVASDPGGLPPHTADYSIG